MNIINNAADTGSDFLDDLDLPDDLTPVPVSTLRVVPRSDAPAQPPPPKPFVSLSPRDVLLDLRASKQINDPGGGSKEPSDAELLVELASDAELFHTREGQAFATIEAGGHRETWPVKSQTFQGWLKRQFYEGREKPPLTMAVEQVVGLLEARATYDGATIAVHIRVAEKDGAIYLDLCNDAWEAVRITPTGWLVVADPPVKFRRTSGMQPLPRPQPGAGLESLRELVNVASDREWVLIVGWLLMALRPRGPYPVLELYGAQGSAKSTTARMLRALVDPSTAPLRSEPKSDRDLMITASNSWVLGVDNSSHLRDSLSDALCRLSIGGGFSTRRLYADGDETIIEAQRPVLLTGIEPVVQRSDLLDRTLSVELPTIPDDARRSEAALWCQFEEARPGLLGALLDAISAAMRNLPTSKPARLPRMADFALWVMAAEPALGWVPGTFEQAYDANRQDTDAAALEASPLTEPLCALATAGGFRGTAQELLDTLRPREFTVESIVDGGGLPKDVTRLAGALRRLAPNLRAVGVAVGFEREGHNGRRVIIITADAEPGC
jgi:hypothetical protein